MADVPPQEAADPSVQPSRRRRIHGVAAATGTAIPSPHHRRVMCHPPSLTRVREAATHLFTFVLDEAASELQRWHASRPAASCGIVRMASDVPTATKAGFSGTRGVGAVPGQLHFSTFYMHPTVHRPSQLDTRGWVGAQSFTSAPAFASVPAPIRLPDPPPARRLAEHGAVGRLSPSLVVAEAPRDKRRFVKAAELVSLKQLTSCTS
jgi:hypothetical protein